MQSADLGYACMGQWRVHDCKIGRGNLIKVVGRNFVIGPDANEEIC